MCFFLHEMPLNVWLSERPSVLSALNTLHMVLTILSVSHIQCVRRTMYHSPLSPSSRDRSPQSALYQASQTRALSFSALNSSCSDHRDLHRLTSLLISRFLVNLQTVNRHAEGNDTFGDASVAAQESIVFERAMGSLCASVVVGADDHDDVETPLEDAPSDTWESEEGAHRVEGSEEQHPPTPLADGDPVREIRTVERG